MTDFFLSHQGVSDERTGQTQFQLCLANSLSLSISSWPYWALTGLFAAAHWPLLGIRTTET